MNLDEYLSRTWKRVIGITWVVVVFVEWRSVGLKASLIRSILAIGMAGILVEMVIDFSLYGRFVLPWFSFFRFNILKVGRPF